MKGWFLIVIEKSVKVLRLIVMLCAAVVLSIFSERLQLYFN